MSVERRRTFAWRCLQGAALAIAGAFPAVAAIALFYGFPIPFGGKPSGLAAVVPSLLAAAFYLSLGGIVVLGLLGTLAGAAAHTLGRGDDARTRRLLITLSLTASFCAALMLATLDVIIGPW
jgi:hypothetical protein